MESLVRISPTLVPDKGQPKPGSPAAGTKEAGHRRLAGDQWLVSVVLCSARVGKQLRRELGELLVYLGPVSTACLN